MLEHEGWTQWLCRLLTGALTTGRVPGERAKSATVLLPKRLQPAGWHETRPITLSSVILKTLAQLLQLRTGSTLRQPSSIQFAIRGRQSAEMTLALLKLVRTAEEWHLPLLLVKLDVRQAFDRISQRKIADMLYQRGAREHPWETALWIDMVRAREIALQVAGAEVLVRQSNGVRQGSPDSPTLFSLVNEEAAVQAMKATQPTGDPDGSTNGSTPLQPGPIPATALLFMDDAWILALSWRQLQSRLDGFVDSLREIDLELGPAKTQVLAAPEAPRGFVTLQGQRIDPVPQGHTVSALGTPIGFRTPQNAPVREACAKARARRRSGPRRESCCRTPRSRSGTACSRRRSKLPPCGTLAALRCNAKVSNS